MQNREEPAKSSLFILQLHGAVALRNPVGVVAPALPTVANAADHSLGPDPAAKCGALSGAGAGATKVDTACSCRGDSIDRCRWWADPRQSHQSGDSQALPRAWPY